MSNLSKEDTILSPTARDEAATIPGANMTLEGGAAGTSSLAGAGGNLVLRGGASGVATLQGLVIVANLPLTDPHVVGALFAGSTAGAASISAG